MPLILFILGFVSILGQVVLLRELNVAFYGIELIYLLAIGVWLLMTGIGAMIGRRGFLPSEGQVRLLILLAGIVLPLNIAYIRGIRILFAGVPGAYLSFPSQMIALIIALALIGLLLGLLFQWAAKQYITNNRTLAEAYAIESAGGVAGGLASTIGLMIGISNLSIGLICSLIAVLCYIPFTPFAVKPVKRLITRLISAVCALILIFFLVTAHKLDFRMTQWNHPSLAVSIDTPYGRITATEINDAAYVFLNDAHIASTEGTAAEEFVHPAMIQRANPSDILVLGGGIEGTISEMLKHNPKAINYVELDRAIIELSRNLLAGDIGQAFDAENVTVTITDPHRYIERTEHSFDVIFIGMPGPESVQTNRFYTFEFFRICTNHLNPDGVVALRLRAADNYWTPLLLRRTASIYRAMSAVFQDVVVLPGTTILILASNRPLSRDSEILAKRLESRDIQTNLVIPDYIRYLYNNDRFFEIETSLKSMNAPLNRDSRPICFQYAVTLWLSKFFPRLGQTGFRLFDVDRLKQPSLGWSMFLILPIFFLIVRRRAGLSRVLLVGMAGFAGMLSETLLIMFYQIKRGVLYQDIGLLLTTFMAGLAVGAWMLGRGKSIITRRLGAILLIGFGLFSGIIAWWTGSSAGAGLITIAIALFLTGWFVAAIFTYASLYRVKDQRLAVGPIYAADLIGGAVGALIGSLLIIPLAGLSITALLMVYIIFISLLII